MLDGQATFGVNDTKLRRFKASHSCGNLQTPGPGVQGVRRSGAGGEAGAATEGRFPASTPCALDLRA